MTEQTLTPTALARPGAPYAGGLYVGITRADDTHPSGHLILLPELPPQNLKWADAVEWAAGLGDGARLPTRNESALLYANVRDHVDTGDWYWTGTSYSERFAWGQYFYYGLQNNGINKSYEARARAVRLIPLTA